MPCLPEVYNEKGSAWACNLSSDENQDNKSGKTNNQRTNGPVNAHLISWPTKAQIIQNLENIWKRNDLDCDLQYSHTFINSISCLHLPTFRSLAAIVSEKSTVFTFSYRKAYVTKFVLALK